MTLQKMLVAFGFTKVYEEKDSIGSLTSDESAHISFETMSALKNPYLVQDSLLQTLDNIDF